MTLATKSTPKKKNYNNKKRELATKLDKLAEKVSNKQIYVIDQCGDFFNIIDYNTHKKIISDLPNLHIADKMCTRINKNRFPQSKLRKIKLILDEYHKLLMDTIFYHYTISNTSNTVTRESTKYRLEITNARMKNLISDLLRS